MSVEEEGKRGIFYLPASGISVDCVDQSPAGSYCNTIINILGMFTPDRFGVVKIVSSGIALGLINCKCYYCLVQGNQDNESICTTMRFISAAAFEKHHVTQCKV